MILSGKMIEQCVHNKEISIVPFNVSQLNPNSYNLKLGRNLLVYKDDVLDMKRRLEVEEIIIPAEGYILHPGKVYLGHTEEYTFTDKYVPMIEGRSSIGRLGLFIHVTAGFGDIGFKGFWTIEMIASQPIRIYAGAEICQIFYHTILGDCELYGKSGKYQDNKGVQPSMLYKDF